MKAKHGLLLHVGAVTTSRFALLTMLASLLASLLVTAFVSQPALGAVQPYEVTDPGNIDPIVQARKDLSILETRVSEATEDATAEELRALHPETDRVRMIALRCVKETERRLNKLRRELTILSPEKSKDKKENAQAESDTGDQRSPPVSAEVENQRLTLESKKASLKEREVTCALMVLRTEDLSAELDGLLQSVLTRQLLTRGPSFVQVLQDNLTAPEKWLAFGGRVALKSAGWEAVDPRHLGGIGAVGLLGLILGYAVPRRLRARARKLDDEKDVSAGLVQALVACALRYAPFIFALGAVSTYLTLTPWEGDDLPYFVNAMHGLLAYFLISAAVRTLLNPCPPARDYLPLPTSVTHPLCRWGRLLVLLLLFGWLLNELRAEGDLDESMFLLAQHALMFILVLNVIWIIWLLRGLEAWRDRWALHLLLTITLIASLVAAWAGYRQLAHLVVLGIVATLVTLGLALLAARVISELFNGLDEGHYQWQRVLRRGIGLKGDEPVPGLGWLRLFVSLAIWIGFAFVVLRIWGLSDWAEADIVRYFSEGFQVAGVTLVPRQLLVAILVLSLLLTLTRWFKGRLEKKWLAKSRMDSGAKEALVTTSGYVGVAMAILVALSVAGIAFTNLAIIAGALSVGIGFGLQNVVNNFVSGLIMLVERPVKRGDWIVVGATEGYVKQISIRSTVIQTRDLADVMVPNSELISGQVTNWMLRDRLGRIKVPLGIAYGSDTAKVRDLLLEVARKHPEVISGSSRVSDPQVLFLARAESSLSFELRCFIHDIDKRFRVTSDLNFAIDAAFREHGVEIPFPQRDLNFRGPLHVEQAAKRPEGASPQSG